ncbi:hypothetical protein PC121_g24755, partial [Phytophthora cactorum]
MSAKSKTPTKARRALLRLRGYVAPRCLSLCWGTYVLGLIWLLLHPAITVTTGELKCRRTYMSENALLIDLMEWLQGQLLACRGLDRLGAAQASPLADGKEAIVLVTQYCNVGADSGENSGLSLGLALLKYLSRAKWLAKDVILLAADDGYLDGSDGYAPGTEAWLQAYHLDPIE